MEEDNSSTPAPIETNDRQIETNEPPSASIKTENDIKKEETPLAKETETDPYFYTKRNEFTSEIYKIEINGLPARFGYGQLKKLLNNKLKLKSHKIKGGCVPNAKWAFVTFRCEEDREKALNVLQGYKWKGKVLSVKKSNPAADPLVKKRNLETTQNEESCKRVKLEHGDGLTDDERMKNAISPLWQVTYEEQLKKKEEEMKRFLVSFGRKIQSTCGLTDWLKEQRDKYKLCCQLKPIVASPVLKSYRNKCEFNVGYASDGETRTVGFRLASYSAGCMTVAPCDGCGIIPDCMKNVVRCFQDYIRDSDKLPFNPENHSGYWRQLTVRNNKNGDIMLIVVMHPQNLLTDDLNSVKNDICDYFRSGAGANCRVISMYFQPFSKSTAGSNSELDLIFGDKYIYETVCGLNFRISPDAFFQVNTEAAEVLYGVIKNLIEKDKETIVLDVCCGTGTIGMILAKDFPKVIGIEMIPSAIEDAKFNSQLNDLKNIEFICGKAEDVILSTLAGLPKTNVVAVVDPPRAGLHNRVIRILRSSHQISSIIYVSCSPKSAILNFEDLTRPVSNQYRGEPFIPISATPVDLFPQTNHCELVIHFSRSLTG